ncbi:MAG: DUF2156 domain-containing protein [Polyangiales bacterium]
MPDHASLASPSELARARALVQRFGWNATAFQTLEPGFSYFFAADDGCVAYADTGAAWVAAGAPIAAPERLSDVASAFMKAAAAQGKRCCFFATEERFRVLPSAPLEHMALGEQPVWDPQLWPTILGSRKSLREQLRRARAKGLRVRLLAASELTAEATQQAFSRVTARWYLTRPMAPMHFLVQVAPFTWPDDRRCFVAELDGRLVGYASVIPVPARPGWFLENLVRDPRAPNGTAESLVDAVMCWAAEQDAHWLTLGLAPLAGEVGDALRLVQRATRFLYDFDGIRAFKTKLRPHTWCPIYLAYPREQGVLRSLLDVLAAFAGSGFVRFGIQTLARGSPAVLRVMTALLAPWTLILALAPVWPWFGSPLVKWGWVAFDVLVFVLLCRLIVQPTAALFRGLQLAITGDALLSILQAAVWNMRQPYAWLDLGVFVLACAAPAFAAWVLQAAYLTHLRTR